jgi:hypothetical protein
MAERPGQEAAYPSIDGTVGPDMAAIPDAFDPEMQALIAEIRHEVAMRRGSEIASAAMLERRPAADEKRGVLGRICARLGRWLRAVGNHRVLRPAMRYVRGGRRLVRALPRLARIDELLATTRDVIAHEQAQNLENFSRQALAMQTELRADIAQLRQRLKVLESAQLPVPALPAATVIKEKGAACAAPRTAVFESHFVATRGADADGGGFNLPTRPPGLTAI